jgi:predicted ATPase
VARRRDQRRPGRGPYVLGFGATVTLLAGDNGTGKSTLVGDLPAATRSALGGALVPVLTSHKPRNGYFLRAESFFNVARLIDSGGILALALLSIIVRAVGEGAQFIIVTHSPILLACPGRRSTSSTGRAAPRPPTTTSTPSG